ncbi:MAG: hypothetical protein IJC99_07350 [Clostridia bacterium]|nr:hypothetical protein [Clostridia bacterium]
MYDFLINGVMLSADGELDARTPITDGGYFLLSHAGKVLHAYAADGLPKVGDDFFAALGTVKGERDVLEKTLLRGAREPYLAQCGSTPVVILRLPYGGNLTLLAVIPPAEIAEILRRPAAYQEALGVPISFSPLSVTATALPDEHAYLSIRDWLRTVISATGGTVLREEQAPHLSEVLKQRLSALARFTGCLVQYDLGTLSYGTVLGADDALLAAMLAALCFTVAPIATSRALHVAVVRDRLGEPRLHVRFYSDSPMPQAALSTLLQSLAPRGMSWQCYQDPTVSALWHLSLPLCAKELSLQQLRNYFGY